jgi:hypothetical protein
MSDLRIVIRLLGSAGYVITGILTLRSYLTDTPLDLTLTVLLVGSCLVSAVWMWQAN